MCNKKLVIILHLRTSRMNSMNQLNILPYCSCFLFNISARFGIWKFWISLRLLNDAFHV